MSLPMVLTTHTGAEIIGFRAVARYLATNGEAGKLLAAKLRCSFSSVTSRQDIVIDGRSSSSIEAAATARVAIDDLIHALRTTSVRIPLVEFRGGPPSTYMKDDLMRGSEGGDRLLQLYFELGTVCDQCLRWIGTEEDEDIWLLEEQEEEEEEEEVPQQQLPDAGMPYLCEVLKGCRVGGGQVEEVSCCKCLFRGNPPEFGTLANAFEGQFWLKTLYFGPNCSIAMECDTDDSIHPLLDVLSNLPRLEDLALNCFIPKTMETNALENSSSLRILRFTNVNVTECQCKQIEGILQRNTSLDLLHLRFRQNHNLLPNNDNQQQQQQPHPVENVAAAIGDNTTLRQLIVEFQTPPTPIRGRTKPLLERLFQERLLWEIEHRNFTLHSVDLRSKRYATAFPHHLIFPKLYKIQYLTKLNRQQPPNKRRSLLRDPTRYEYLVNQYHSNVPAMFYYLSEDPELLRWLLNGMKQHNNSTLTKTNHHPLSIQEYAWILVWIVSVLIAIATYCFYDDDHPQVRATAVLGGIGMFVFWISFTEWD